MYEDHSIVNLNMSEISRKQFKQTPNSNSIIWETPKSLFGASMFDIDLNKSSQGNSNEDTVKNLWKENAWLIWENRTLK